MTVIATTPGENACLDAVRAFIADILSIEAWRTQENRVPEPNDPNFVMMTPGRMPRLATNLNEFADCAFAASIVPTSPADGTGTMTVTEVYLGVLTVGATVFGADVATDTKIVSGPTGGGIGAYVVDIAQTVTAEDMAAGVQAAVQKVQWEIQLDFYGPNSSNNAVTFSTLFRDEYAVTFFGNAASDITPLYADDPRQAVFVMEEQQYQGRWIVQAQFDVDVKVTLPQQFADQLVPSITNVDAVYPPLT